MPAVLRQFLAGARVLLGLTLLLGVAYPLAVTAAAQLAFRRQANGSPLAISGHAAGSTLLGQPFSGPQWFHPRPSAAGNDYDTTASGASNLGPTSGVLQVTIEQRRLAVARENGVDPARVPADAVTASGSGLDPHISPAYAALQVDRVARARGLDPAVLQRLVAAHTDGRALGFLGEPRVNVVTLNAALPRPSP